MAKSLFIAPSTLNSGLTSVSLGLIRALDQIGVRVGFFKPITQVTTSKLGSDLSSHFAKTICNIDTYPPIAIEEAEAFLNRGDKDLLMERLVGAYHSFDKNYDVIIVEGLVPEKDTPFSNKLNVEIAKNLNAEVILVADPKGMSNKDLDKHLKTAAGVFSSPEDPDILGCILNKVTALSTNSINTESLLFQPDSTAHTNNASAIKNTPPNYKAGCSIFTNKFKLLGQIPLDPNLIAPRTEDIVNECHFEILNEGDLKKRRIFKISICARTIPNLISALTPGCLVVTPGDRTDVLLAACMAALNGTPLAGIVLTGNYTPEPQILRLCQSALKSGLPLLLSKNDTFQTAIQLSNLSNKVPVNDINRMNSVMTTVADHLDIEWFKTYCAKERATRLSPPAFRYQLSENARLANKTIILPEGNEPRTINAAVICHERKLASCILIGKKLEIYDIASSLGLKLPADISIIDPDEVREKYVIPMTELRKSKGVTSQMARAMLEDNVVLATMMLALDEVDGLVSGAVHTTANTVRPALQLIKTTPNAKVVSSVFFMCLPEQVLVYGDCAINPDPNAEELADIAIQSADSAIAFGIDPKIAMISYSTGQSGTGNDVDKVREATRIAQEKRPNLLIDGPLQYDAAAIESVAMKKAPNSLVAGKATVFIFPDLNTGNTTYKAVQRSANVISIGPMLQGLRKPVNDLSRGALVEDIVFTIALTAVQATQK
ncbi:MAG: phosphate acetyltransferase [Pseudohongiellaceae bacterium]|jgi:phosphate acetyltransferase